MVNTKVVSKLYNDATEVVRESLCFMQLHEEWTPASQEDLRKIKAYSLTTWVKRQTQNYLADMEVGLEHLVLSPKLGKKRDDLATKLF